MNETNTPNTNSPPGPDSRPPAAGRRVTAFDPRRLTGQLARDSFVRGMLFFVLPAGLILIGGSGVLARPLWAMGLAVLAGLWLVISVTGARAWQRVVQLTSQLEHNPAAAEAQLAVALDRWALHRSIRLMIYHRLAVLRHYQQQFAEVALICDCLLRQRLGSADQIRPHLLLMLAESRLILGDHVGAYLALSTMTKQKLNLVQTLQRTALQTRYLIETNHHEAALDQWPRTVAMAELMPAPQCGAMHAMLAIAAERQQRMDLAHWFQRRAAVISTPEQIHALLGHASSGSIPTGNFPGDFPDNFPAKLG
ncbi:MAG: hypothetical protein IT440_00785 [Phycisphaeraceae bacterium]|nr:hypothetical protein [Phycisphaeraceae bacterium]